MEIASNLRGYLATVFVLFFLISATTIYEVPEITDAVSSSTSNWHRGVSIDPASVESFTTEEFRQSLSNIASTGANHVTFVINIYQVDINSNEMHVGNEVPSDEALRDAIQHAHSLGLSSGIKFHMETHDAQWRAFINPTDKNVWFSSYSDKILHYAQIAQEEGVQELVIGAELVNIASEAVDPQNTQLWQGLISSLRDFYSGQLTYSANWGGTELFNEKDNIGFWSELDYIGIAAYYPLTRDPDRPIESMTEHWDSINAQEIKPLQQAHSKPVKFTEVGYRSVNDANLDPYASGRSGTYDPQIQSELYEALFAYWSEQDFFAGVDLWDWEGNPEAGGEGDTDYTPQNKPALNIITTWFGGSGAPPEPDPDPEPTEPEETEPEETEPEEHDTEDVSFDISATNSTENPQPGVEMETTVEVTSNKDIQNIIIHMEVRNSANGLSIRYYYYDDFEEGKPNSYTFAWAPSEEDDMTLNAGLFTPEWREVLYWENNLHEFIVRFDESEQEQAQTRERNWWRGNAWWEHRNRR